MGETANREMKNNRIPADGLTVDKELFGKMPDRTPVDKYSLSNVHRTQVGILTYGGSCNP